MRACIPGRLLACLLLINGTASARNFSGFLTPESTGNPDKAPIPISASATIEVNGRVSGSLRLREVGEYRLEGSLEAGRLRLRLYDTTGAPAGNADGTLQGSRIESVLVMSGRHAEIVSKGRLEIEGASEWRASSVTKKKMLRDRKKRFWYDPDFDDSDWEETELPDDNAFGDEVKHARFYRSAFDVNDGIESLGAVFSSDDGIWIYINGRYLGHWGADENQPGCVNDPLGRCGLNGTVHPVPIPQEFLRPGKNVIAVKVNNGACCFTYFNLLLTRVSARFLPAAR